VLGPKTICAAHYKGYRRGDIKFDEALPVDYPVAAEANNELRYLAKKMK